MITYAKQIALFCGLFWNHIVFWCFQSRDESYYTNMGLIFLELGKTESAINAFEMSQKAHGYRNVEFSKCNWFSLGYCYLELGDFKNAIRYFEDYLRFDSNNVEILSIVGWCHELTHNYEATLKNYTKAISLDPESKALHIECSKIYSDMDRKKEAIEQLELVSSKVDATIEKDIIRSIHLKIDGKLDESVEVLKHTISEIDRTGFVSDYFYPHDIHMLLAGFQKESGDLKGALSTLEISYSRHPDDLWLTNELAMEYADQNVNLFDALELINSILKLQPYNSIFIDTKGWILCKMKKTEEAKDLFRLSLALNPNNKEATDHYNTLLGSTPPTMA